MASSLTGGAVQKSGFDTYVSTKNSILKGSFAFDGDYNSLDNVMMMEEEEGHKILDYEQNSNKNSQKKFIESDEKIIYKIRTHNSPASTMSNGSYSKYHNILDSNISQMPALDDNERARIICNSQSPLLRKSKEIKNIAIPEGPSSCVGCNLI